MTITVTPAMSKAAAAARIGEALAHIQRAQDELSSACADLSAICGGAPVWKKCHALTDRVHAFWYVVDRFRNGGKFHLDSMNVDSLRKALERAEARALEGMGGDAVLDRSVP